MAVGVRSSSSMWSSLRFASPTSPSGRYRLVALTRSWDLFVCARDLFDGANAIIFEPLPGTIATTAATNKCLAQSNKSRTGGKATKKNRQKSEVGLMKYHACRRHARCHHPCGNLGILTASEAARRRLHSSAAKASAPYARRARAAHPPAAATAQASNTLNTSCVSCLVTALHRSRGRHFRHARASAWRAAVHHVAAAFLTLGSSWGIRIV
jgi:hypothetical protein